MKANLPHASLPCCTNQEAGDSPPTLIVWISHKTGKEKLLWISQLHLNPSQEAVRIHFLIHSAVERSRPGNVPLHGHLLDTDTTPGENSHRWPVVVVFLRVVTGRRVSAREQSEQHNLSLGMPQPEGCSVGDDACTDPRCNGCNFAHRRGSPQLQ